MPEYIQILFGTYSVPEALANAADGKAHKNSCPPLKFPCYKGKMRTGSWASVVQLQSDRNSKKTAREYRGRLLPQPRELESVKTSVRRVHFVGT